MPKYIYRKSTGQLMRAPVTSLTSDSSAYEPMSLASQISANRMAVALMAAEGGSTAELFTIYRDNVMTWAHLQAEFSKRKLAVLTQPVSIVPFNHDDPLDKEAAESCTNVVESVPGWITALSHLLDSVIWPVAVVEKVFEIKDGRYELARLIPVPHHLLDFTTGTLKIRATRPDGQPSAELLEPDPARYIVHRAHLLSVPDKLGGPMRAVLYWWLFATQSRDWWMRFLQRYGIPLMIGKYPHGADDQRTLLLRAMSTLNRSVGLAITKDTQLEFQQIAQLAGDPFIAVQSFANSEISKLVLGQTLSATATPTGLGSGTADLQGEVRSDLTMFDRARLAETLRDQLYSQYCEVNAIAGNVPRVILGPAADPTDLLAILKAMRDGGLQPTLEALPQLSQKFGFPIERAASPALVPSASAAFSALLSALD
jgi:phage gp29-like protein